MAAKEAGLPITKYYSSEVDKYAIQQTKHNFPEVIHIGDVREVDVSKLEPIDILIGGSPCTQFSFAGKRKGMSTSCEQEILKLEQYLELKAEGFQFEGQSYLFWEYMRILKDIQKYNPNVLFLLENVEMNKKWERVLSEAIGIFGVHLNSNLVSAQNRARIYWTNIRVRKEGLFDELYSDIPPPEDRGILLKDVLETNVDEKYYLSDKMVKSLTDWGERNAQNGNGFKPEIKEVNEKSAVLTTGSMKSSSTYVKVDKKLNPKPNQDKASCFTAGGHSGGNHSDMDLLIVAMRGREITCLTPKRTEYGKEIRKEYERGLIKEHRKNIQQLEPRQDGKTNTLTSVQKDNLVMQINPSLESGGKQPYQQNRIYDTEGISPALCANKADLLITDNKPSKDGLIHSHTLVGGKWDKTHESSCRVYDSEGKMKTITAMGGGNQEPKVHHKSRIRRLTVKECSRLQTVPEEYEWIVSDSQAYKLIGNGWTVSMIAHIFKHICH